MASAASLALGSVGVGSICRPIVCPSVSARRASSLEASSSYTETQGSRHGYVSYRKEMAGQALPDTLRSVSSQDILSGRCCDSVVSMSYLPAGHADWWRKPSQPHGGLFGPPGSPLDWSTPDFRLCGPGTHLADGQDEGEEDGSELATDFSFLEEGPAMKTSASRGRDAGVPVYVMLPLDSISMNNTISRPRAFMASLTALKSAGVEGVMMDVWWGIVEKEPGVYSWDAYKELVAMVKDAGLKLQAVMSFHQCGGNVGDHCTIPLPPWVLQEMAANPDIAYTDRSGGRNFEYISLGCDDVPVLLGRTPIEVYTDFMRSFRVAFGDNLGSVITEIQVGMGPAGELRYPSYPERDDCWRFPGIGEFQCYDKYMLQALGETAEAIGKPLWGLGGPHDSGTYKQWPDETGFFRMNGSWKSPYGEFFMQWYADMLLHHGDRVLSAARHVFRRCQVHISGKVAGIHWHYWTHSHAAELTAGYYNTVRGDGYVPLARLFGKHNATLNFTCFEMRDQEQPRWAGCSPEGLLRQVVGAAKREGVRISGENALPRYDASAHDQIVRQSRLQFEGISSDEPMATFTFLRMSERLFRPENWTNFVLFVRQMNEGRTFQPWEEAHHKSHVHIRSIGSLSKAAAELMVL